jgi:hypothetical protein
MTTAGGYRLATSISGAVAGHLVAKFPTHIGREKFAAARERERRCAILVPKNDRAAQDEALVRLSMRGRRAARYGLPIADDPGHRNSAIPHPVDALCARDLGMFAITEIAAEDAGATFRQPRHAGAPDRGCLGGGRYRARVLRLLALRGPPPGDFDLTCGLGKLSSPLL